jgi:hypothetical protein
VLALVEEGTTVPVRALPGGWAAGVCLLVEGVSPRAAGEAVADMVTTTGYAVLSVASVLTALAISEETAFTRGTVVIARAAMLPIGGQVAASAAAAGLTLWARLATLTAVVAIDRDFDASAGAEGLTFGTVALALNARRAGWAAVAAGAAIVFVDEWVPANAPAAESPLRADLPATIAVAGVNRDLDALAGAAGLKTNLAAIAGAEVTAGAGSGRCRGHGRGQRVGQTAGQCGGHCPGQRTACRFAGK